MKMDPKHDRVVMWTGLCWFGTKTTKRCCENGNDTLGPIRCGEFHD